MSTCIIKVIQNSGQQRKYSITRELSGNIKIMVRIQEFPTDLDYMAAALREELIFKKRYEVLFDFKSASDTIRNYIPFREAMIRLLYKKNPELDTDALVEIVKFHMQKGKHPDISKIDDPKTLTKINNYINSVCGQTLTKTQVIDICKKISLY
jgi:hypothetical protein